MQTTLAEFVDINFIVIDKKYSKIINSSEIEIE